jgi:hypothetical protein
MRDTNNQLNHILHSQIKNVRTTHFFDFKLGERVASRGRPVIIMSFGGPSAADHVTASVQDNEGKTRQVRYETLEPLCEEINAYSPDCQHGFSLSIGGN